jgi:D-aminoacyl-tRNA deacylase
VRYLVASEQDDASVNQREALREIGSWKEDAAFAGRPSYRGHGWALVSIPELHLNRDHLDRDLELAFDERVELVVYLSKHRSESGRPSLTVHPLGNAHAADLGGQPETLVPSSPGWMTAALRALKHESRGLAYEVTFEATHHGPFLSAPAFFIEQGSTQAEWADREASRAIARTLIGLEEIDAPFAVGVGGGHYVPRHTDLALRRRIAFGHLLASYAMEGSWDSLLSQAVDRTPGATLAYVHRKAFARAEARAIEEGLAAHGLRVVREGELESNERHKTS